MNKTSPFSKLFDNREVVVEAPLEEVALPQAQVPPEPRQRGRPATGKRSDDNWIGRTYYVQKETDLDVEDELLKLKRRGKEVDKSELVNLLLSAWVKWQQGENIELLLTENTPRRKSEK
jgi:hypothetical protein